MDTIFVNSENSKTSKLHVLILKLAKKRLSPYQVLVFIRHGKTLKVHTITINLKHLHQHGMINLNYQMDRILYQIFKIILNIFLKNMEKILINHQYKYM